MLTLTREIGEKIVIGDDVVVTVLSVSENGRVRLGIEAPRQIRIDRAEVLERIRRENVEAGELPSDRLAFAAYAARQANERSASRRRGRRRRLTRPGRHVRAACRPQEVCRDVQPSGQAPPCRMGRRVPRRGRSRGAPLPGRRHLHARCRSHPRPSGADRARWSSHFGRRPRGGPARRGDHARESDHRRRRAASVSSSRTRPRHNSLARRLGPRSATEHEARRAVITPRARRQS